MKVFIIDAACLVLYYNICYCEAVSKLGVHIEILTSKFKYDHIEPPASVKIKYMFFKLGALLDRYFDWKSFRRIYRIIEYPFNLLYLLGYTLWSKPDVIHYSWSNVPKLDYYIIWILKRMGFAIVYTAHNAFPHEMKIRHFRDYSKIYKLADKIIVLTEFVRNEIRSHCHIEDHKMVTIAHGNYNYIINQFKQNEGVSKNGRRTVGFIGLIRPYKGLKYLLTAFSQIIKHVPQVQLSIVGKSLENFQFYQTMIRDLGIAEHITTDVRFIPMKDMVSIIKTMDVVVFPYIAASQSGSIAMLYELGIPVVVTDVGGLPEMVAEGESGYIVPARDEAKLAQAIIRALNNERHLYTLKNSAKAFGERHFSWDVLAPKAVALYNELLPDSNFTM